MGNRNILSLDLCHMDMSSLSPFSNLNTYDLTLFQSMTHLGKRKKKHTYSKEKSVSMSMFLCI